MKARFWPRWPLFHDIRSECRAARGADGQRHHCVGRYRAEESPGTTKSRHLRRAGRARFASADGMLYGLVDDGTIVTIAKDGKATMKSKLETTLAKGVSGTVDSTRSPTACA